MKKNTRGFTLIELLVVIAIIGVLSAVVLASLNAARAKGADAAIKGDLSGIRSQASIYFDDYGNYGVDATDCVTAGSVFTDTHIAGAIAQAEFTSAASSTCYADDGIAGAGLNASSWALSVPLKANPAQSWCIDSAGVATTGVASLVSDVAMCQ